MSRDTMSLAKWKSNSGVVADLLTRGMLADRRIGAKFWVEGREWLNIVNFEQEKETLLVIAVSFEEKNSEIKSSTPCLLVGSQDSILFDIRL